MNIEISREDVLLDTGGGLKKAAYFLAEDGDDEKPFILHNVDVLSTIDLRRMAQFHTDNKALATLAVQDRETSRYLLFDEQHRLCGRRCGTVGRMEVVRSSQQVQALAFSGIHVISRAIPGYDDRNRRLLHHYFLSASRCAKRKHSRLQGRRILLA